MRTFTCLLPKVQFFVVLSLALMVCQVQPSHAQQEGAVVPASYQGSSSFFHKQLGTALRFNYHTRGYGTQDDVVSIGGMKVMSLDDVSTMYLDGQGTLSDDFGGGFNLGVGYRQLTNSTSPIMSIDPERILGVGFWTDGQSTSSDNFFTQLGFSLESLGESFDLRLNGHFPLERTKTGDPTISSFGTPIFQGNNLFGSMETFAVDTALTVIDSEFAKRLGDLDAWAFVGGYHLDGGTIDTQGFRAGVRGYAVPDVALSLQVSDDDIYATNVMFGITWFVGRTHSGNAPCGTLADRMREPVLRNDFIATTSSRGSRASGNAEVDTDTGVAENFFFVDSNAAAGGNGTVENPFRTLTEAQNAHGVDDTIIVASNSTFTDTITLMNDADLLGFGNNITHIFQGAGGAITLPEFQLGGNALPAAVLNLAAGTTGITTGDNNRVNNFTINNGGTAVSATGSNGLQLSNLAITGSTGDAIVLNNVTGQVLVENTVTIDNAVGRALFINGGASNLSLAQTITNAVGRSVEITGRTGGTVTFSGTVDDTGEGIRVANNTGGNIDFTNALTLNTGVNTAVDVVNNTGAAVSFNDLDITTTTGIGFNATGGGTLAVASANGTNNITTTTGVGLNIEGMTVVVPAGTTPGNVLFDEINVSNGAGRGINLLDLAGAGGVTVNGGTLRTAGTAINIDNAQNVAFSNVTIDNDDTSGAGINVQNNTTGSRAFTDVVVRTRDQVAVNVNDNSGGTTRFTTLTADSTAGGVNAINIENNTDGIVDIDTATITSAAGRGLFVSGNTNTAAVNLNDLDVDTTTGTGLFVSGGGTITTGGTSTIDSTGGVGIDVENAENATIANVTVNAAAANAVNVIHSNATASNVTLNNLTVASAGGRGVNVLANGTGEFDLTMAGATIGTVGTEGILFDTGANAGRVDFTLNGGSDITAGDSSALLATLDDSATADVRFVIDNNNFANASGTAGADVAAVDIRVADGVEASVRVGGLFVDQERPPTVGDNNSITNSSVDGDSFRASVDGATSTLSLDLRDNTVLGGDVQFVLNQTNGSTFNLVDRDDTLSVVPADANNVGSVIIGVGTINTIAPPILAPTP